MKKNFLYVLVCLLLLAGCSTTNSTGGGTNKQLPSLEENANETHANQSLETLESNFTPLEGSSSLEDESLLAAPNDEQTSNRVQTEPDEYDYVLIFPSDRYPETALHIYNAIENGHSDVCTIDREGADENRKQSLQGIDTRDGYDRDEWPMAMCEEGGYGASVAYIDSSDNRGAGSWVGHQLSAYDNGERVLFIVEKPQLSFPFGEGSKDNTKVSEDIDETPIEVKVTYNNCSEARDAGVTPLFEGEPGYSKKLDRDGDGIACEA